MGESLAEGDELATAVIEGGSLGASTAEASLQSGDRIGRYDLVRRLGAGGMGVVWVARDPRLQRSVALKVLHEKRRGRGTQARERLRREAVALARLSHPNVVAIYDVGIHEGRVFLTMEHIEGRTLEDWVVDKPNLLEVLEVFEQAAAGLAAVHDAGFVHRDFKPANVMVDREGRVTVMDFGLARLGDPELASQDETTASSSGWSVDGSSPFSSVLTCDGVIMGTPAYMAPEQHIGDAADARADLFSFCATLFEILAGRRPFLGRTLKELAVDKHRGQLDFADTRVKMPRALRALLRRGLDPDPSRRHVGMHALHEELSRVRRRRPLRWAGLGAAGVVVLGAAGWVGLVHADPDACDAGKDRIAEVWSGEDREGLGDAFAKTGLSYAEDAATRTIDRLDSYAERWTVAHHQACAAATRGEVLAADLDLRMRCLVDARRSMGVTVELLVDADVELVRHAVGQVVGLMALADCEDMEALRAAVPMPQDPAIVNALEELRARLESVRALDLAGRYEEGYLEGKRVLADARTIGHEPTIARAQIRVASLEMALGNFDVAATLLGDAALLAAGVDDHEAATDAATRLVFVLVEELGRSDEALRWVRHAQASLERLPPNPLAEARLEGMIGIVHARAGEHARALEHFERAYEAKKAVLGEEHPEVVSALENTALSHSELGRLVEAEKIHRRAVAIMESVLGPRHPDYAHSLMNLGYAVGVLGRHDEEVELFTRALGIQEEAFGAHHPMVARTLAALGQVASTQDRLHEAEAYQRRAAGIIEEVFGKHHRQYAWMVADQAIITSQLGRDEEALRLYRRAREILEDAEGSDHQGIVMILLNEATSFIELERVEEARVALGRAGEILSSHFEAGHPDWAMYYANRGKLVRAEGDMEEARRLFVDALKISRAAFGVDHPETASVLLSLGEVEHALERGEPAREHLEQALAIIEAGSVSEAFASAARFSLGKVLWDDSSSRASARPLILRAREGFAGYGTTFDEDVVEIDAWLRTHRS